MDSKGKGMVVNDKEKESLFNEPRDNKPTDSGSSHKKKDGKKKRCIKKIVYYDSDCRRFDPGGSLDRRVNCRHVPQPRWVGARWSAKGGNQRETGVKGKPAAFVFVPHPGRVRLQ